jgi:hypothetical protein
MDIRVIICVNIEYFALEIQTEARLKLWRSIPCFFSNFKRIEIAPQIQWKSPKLIDISSDLGADTGEKTCGKTNRLGLHIRHSVFIWKKRLENGYPRDHMCTSAHRISKVRSLKGEAREGGSDGNVC